MPNPVGRPPEPRRKFYSKRFGVSLDQLDRCADASAVRLLLGKGKRNG